VAGWLTGMLTKPKRGGQRGGWYRGGGRGNGGCAGFVGVGTVAAAATIATNCGRPHQIF